MATMKTFFTTLLICILFMHCEDENTSPEKHQCSIPATVRDFTQFGCYYGFELEDGTLLLPYRILECGTPPLPKEVIEDPLMGVTLADGQSVLIEYTDPPKQPELTICMNGGKYARLTCLTQQQPATQDR